MDPDEQIRKIYETQRRLKEAGIRHFKEIEEMKNKPLCEEYAVKGFDANYFDHFNVPYTGHDSSNAHDLMNVSIPSTNGTDSIATGASASHYINNNNQHNRSLSKVNEFEEPMNIDHTIQTQSSDKEPQNAIIRPIPVKLSSSNPKLFTSERKQIQIVVEIDFAAKGSNATNSVTNASGSLETMLTDALSGALSKVIDENDSDSTFISEESSLLKSQSNQSRINLNKSNNQPFPPNNRMFAQPPAIQQVLNLPPNQNQTNFDIPFTNNATQPNGVVNHNNLNNHFPSTTFVQPFAYKPSLTPCTRNNFLPQPAPVFQTNSLNVNQTNNLNSTMNNWQAPISHPPMPTGNYYAQPNLNSNVNNYVYTDPAAQANSLMNCQKLMSMISQHNSVILQQQQSIQFLYQKLQSQIVALNSSSTLNQFNQLNTNPINNGFYDNAINMPPPVNMLPDNSRFVNNQPVANNTFAQPEPWLAPNQLRQSQNDTLQTSTPLLNSHQNNCVIYKSVCQQQINPTASVNRGPQFVDNVPLQVNIPGKFNQSRTPQMISTNFASNSQSKMFFNAEMNGPSDEGILANGFAPNGLATTNMPSSKLQDANLSKKSVNFSTNEFPSSQSPTETPTTAQVTMLYELLKKLLDNFQENSVLSNKSSSKSSTTKNEQESLNVSAIGGEIVMTDSLNKSLSSKSGRTKAASVSPRMSLPLSNNNFHSVSHAVDPTLNDHPIVVGTQCSRPLVAADGQSCESEAVLPKAAQPVVLPNVSTAISNSVVLNRSNLSPALSSVSSNRNHLFLTRPEVTGARRINLTPVTILEQDSGTANGPRREPEDEDEDEEEMEDEESDHRTDLHNIKLKRQTPVSLASLSNEQSSDLKLKTQVVTSIATVGRVRFSGDGEQQSL